MKRDCWLRGVRYKEESQLQYYSENNKLIFMCISSCTSLSLLTAETKTNSPWTVQPSAWRCPPSYSEKSEPTFLLLSTIIHLKGGGAWGSVVVKGLRYKSLGPGIDSKRWCLESILWPGVISASKNEYQDIPGGKGGRWVRVTTLPPSCAECLVIWSLNRPEPSGSP